MSACLRTTAPAAALVLLVATSAPAAAAAACDGSSDPCVIDLGRVTAGFAQGAASYGVGAELTGGSDAYYGAVPVFLPTLQEEHAPAHDGFSFLPQVYASVGGSGYQGFHEVRAYFEFNGLTFSAKPGWRLDGVEFGVSGGWSAVGDGYAGFELPGAATVSGDAFGTTAVLNPDDAAVRAGFFVSAPYQQGDDGTALSYGMASASFGRAYFLAYVSAVPEPGAAALLPAGLGAVGFAVARRRQGRRTAQCAPTAVR